MPRSVLLRIFSSLWVTYLFHFQPLAAGSDRFVLLMRAIIEQRTFVLDAYGTQLDTSQGILYNGHLYSDLNPGLSLLAAPFWGLIVPIYHLLPATHGLRQAAVEQFMSHAIATLVTSSLLTAIASCVLALVIYHKTQRVWRGVLGAFLYGLGSIAFFFSTHANQNVAIAALTFLIYICLFVPQVLKLTDPRWAAVALGLLWGLGLLIDITMLPMMVVSALFLVVQYRDRLQDLVFVLVGAIAPLTVLLVYQAVCFGSPLMTAAGIFVSQMQDTPTSLGAELWRGGLNLHALGTYLFSLKAGLLIYHPYTLLALAYLLLFWGRQRRFLRSEKTFFVATNSVYLLMVMAIPPEYLRLHFGPRHLLPLLPFVCLVFAVYCPRKLNGSAIALTALGYFINFAGAQQGTATDNVLRSTALYLLQLPAFPLLTWLQTEFPDVGGGGIQAGGFFLLWLGILTLIWLPAWRQKPAS